MINQQMRGLMVLPLPANQMAQNIKVLASWGANLIRWQLVAPADKLNNWTIAQYKNWLDEQLIWLDGSLPLLKEKGVSVVLDMHTPVGGVIEEHWGQKNKIFVDDSFRAAYISNWQYMATEYKDNSTIIAYDLLNEPGIMKSEKWQSLAQSVALAIREIDSNKILVVESTQGSPATIVNLKPLSDISNVVYSVHMYLPNEITFQGIPDADCNMIPIGEPYPSSTINKETLEKALKHTIAFQNKYSVPIYIGEFSCARWSGYPKTKNAYNYLKDCISIFESNKWSWSYHAFRESAIWELEYDETPCSDKCNPNCSQDFKVTKRQTLVMDAFKKNN